MDTSGVATVEDVRRSCTLYTYFLVSERASKQGFDSGNVVSITSGADTGVGQGWGSAQLCNAQRENAGKWDQGARVGTWMVGNSREK